MNANPSTRCSWLVKVHCTWPANGFPRVRLPHVHAELGTGSLQQLWIEPQAADLLSAPPGIEKVDALAARLPRPV